MKVLVVDDEELIRNVIKEYLKIEGYLYLEASDGIEAIEVVKRNKDIDVIIMDIMMPRLDGYSAMKQINEIVKIPTIMLSARKEEYDKLIGFDLGIDDYVTKPFSPKELMARIKAVSKRNNNQDKFTYENLEVDFLAHTIKIDSKEIMVTPKEFELMDFFIKNVNIALSREQLLSKVWGYDYFGEDRTIDTHIKMLRSHLEKYRDLIKTVRGVGYKLEIKEE
ncbi:MAG TPA: response regulator transcription factor [Bacilli bacterium]|nr:response regulator transcription factor [Bacilli bacterium]